MHSTLGKNVGGLSFFLVTYTYTYTMIDVRVLINTDFGRARGKCRWGQELDKIVIWRCLTPPTVWPYLQQFELHYRSKLYTLPPTHSLLPFPSSLDYCQGKCLKARLIKVASSDRQRGKEGEGRGRARLRAKVSGARWLLTGRPSSINMENKQRDSYSGRATL